MGKINRLPPVPADLQCQHQLLRPGSYQLSHCSRQGQQWTVEGKWVCTQHSPEAEARRMAKSTAKYEDRMNRLSTFVNRQADYLGTLQKIAAFTRPDAGVMQRLAINVLKKYGDYK